MNRLRLIISLLGAWANLASAQSPWRTETSGTTAQLRGLSVVSAKVAWASGTKGTVLRTVDGDHWLALPVPGAGALDFRDIHAVDAHVAYVMAAGPGAASCIYKSTDGGGHWALQIANPDPDGFWDAIAFWDADHGIVMGDPVKGLFQARLTADGGATWIPVADAAGLAALPNEGGFAASGTCLSVFGDREVWFATGGAKMSRVLHSSDRGQTWRVAATPVPAGGPPKGLFSVAFITARRGFAVGGDYEKPQLDALNGACTEDGGLTWSAAPVLPTGFLSVVATIPGHSQIYVAAGGAGSGFSADAGRTWTVLDQIPVHTVGFSDRQTGWSVGAKGLVRKYVGKALSD
ncbi:MAG: glycosyl hydrolase [Opitutus sp.]|nr:glycosyl hydrolase [Opitutus sp.]